MTKLLLLVVMASLTSAADEGGDKKVQPAIDVFTKECLGLKVEMPSFGQQPAEEEPAEESDRCSKLLTGAQEEAAELAFAVDHDSPEFLTEVRRLWPLLSEKDREILLPHIHKAAGPKQAARKAGAAPLDLNASVSAEVVRDALGSKPSGGSWNKAFDGAGARGGAVPLGPETAVVAWGRTAAAKDPKIEFTKPAATKGVPPPRPVHRVVPDAFGSVMSARPETWSEWGWKWGMRGVHAVGATVAIPFVEAPLTVVQTGAGGAALIGGSAARGLGRTAEWMGFSSAEALSEWGGRTAVQGGSLLLGIPARVVNAVSRPVTTLAGAHDLVSTAPGSLYERSATVVTGPLMDDRHKTGRPGELQAASLTIEKVAANSIREGAREKDPLLKATLHASGLAARWLPAGMTLVTGNAIAKLGELPGAVHAINLAGMGIGAIEQNVEHYRRFRDAKPGEDTEEAAVTWAGSAGELAMVGGATAASMMRARAKAAEAPAAAEAAAMRARTTGGNGLAERLAANETARNRVELAKTMVEGQALSMKSALQKSPGERTLAEAADAELVSGLSRATGLPATELADGLAQAAREVPVRRADLGDKGFAQYRKDPVTGKPEVVVDSALAAKATAMELRLAVMHELLHHIGVGEVGAFAGHGLGYSSMQAELGARGLRPDLKPVGSGSYAPRDPEFHQALVESAAAAQKGSEGIVPLVRRHYAPETLNKNLGDRVAQARYDLERASPEMRPELEAKLRKAEQWAKDMQEPTPHESWMARKSNGRDPSVLPSAGVPSRLGDAPRNPFAGVFHPEKAIAETLRGNAVRAESPAELTRAAENTGYTEKQVRETLYGSPEAGGQRVPLGMTPEAFVGFQADIKGVLADYGLTDTRVSVQGSGATVWSTNPKKAGKTFDPKTSDYDIVFEGDGFRPIVEGAPQSMPGWVGGRGMGGLGHKPAGLTQTLGERLNALRQTWSDRTGREVNFGAAVTPDMSVPGGIPVASRGVR